MRQKLREQEGTRKTFQGVFVRFGKRVNFKGYSEDTLLIKDVIDVETRQRLTDHVWFSVTKGFDKLNLTSGVVLRFDARVATYKKGYVNKQYGIDRQTTDYRLSHPTKITIVDPLHSA